MTGIRRASPNVPGQRPAPHRAIVPAIKSTWSVENCPAVDQHPVASAMASGLSRPRLASRAMVELKPESYSAASRTTTTYPSPARGKATRLADEPMDWIPRSPRWGVRGSSSIYRWRRRYRSITEVAAELVAEVAAPSVDPNPSHFRITCRLRPWVRGTLGACPSTRRSCRSRRSVRRTFPRRGWSSILPASRGGTGCRTGAIP